MSARLRYGAQWLLPQLLVDWFTAHPFTRGHPLYTCAAAAAGLGLGTGTGWFLLGDGPDTTQFLARLAVVGLTIAGAGAVIRALAHRGEQASDHRADHFGKLMSVTALGFTLPVALIRVDGALEKIQTSLGPAIWISMAILLASFALPPVFQRVFLTNAQRNSLAAAREDRDTAARAARASRAQRRKQRLSDARADLPAK